MNLVINIQRTKENPPTGPQLASKNTKEGIVLHKWRKREKAANVLSTQTPISVSGPTKATLPKLGSQGEVVHRTGDDKMSPHFLKIFWRTRDTALMYLSVSCTRVSVCTNCVCLWVYVNDSVWLCVRECKCGCVAVYEWVYVRMCVCMTVYVNVSLWTEHKHVCSPVLLSCLCECMHVRMCVWVCIHLYISTDVNIFFCVFRLCAHVWKCRCINVCGFVCIFLYMYEWISVPCMNKY